MRNSRPGSRYLNGIARPEKYTTLTAIRANAKKPSDGTAAGSAFPAATGPVGWTIAGAAGLISAGVGVLASKKNTQAANDADVQRKKIEEAIRRHDRVDAEVKALLAQFPDLSMTIEALVAEGDTVAVRVLSTGTNLGPLNGALPATGRTFHAEQTHWFRLECGRIAEHWATRDDLTSMLQLGVVDRPGSGAGRP
jgi:predicted ester cyclase